MFIGLNSLPSGLPIALWFMIGISISSDFCYIEEVPKNEITKSKNQKKSIWVGWTLLKYSDSLLRWSLFDSIFSAAGLPPTVTQLLNLKSLSLPSSSHYKPSISQSRSLYLYLANYPTQSLVQWLITWPTSNDFQISPSQPHFDGLCIGMNE